MPTNGDVVALNGAGDGVTALAVKRVLMMAIVVDHGQSSTSVVK